MMNLLFPLIAGIIELTYLADCKIISREGEVVMRDILAKKKVFTIKDYLDGRNEG